MTTKRLKKKNLNKTKRNTNTTIINAVYSNNSSNTENEKRLACFLVTNNKIKQFAFNIFYYMLNYWKTIIPNKWASVIKHSLIENIRKNTIHKIGFTQYEFEKIIDIVMKKDKQQLTKYLDTKLLKVTAAINNLCEPEYTIYHVNFNKQLQKKFIIHFEKILLVKHITWNEIMKYYVSLKNKADKQMYNFFVFDLIYGADKKVDSIYRDNLGNMNFFRNRLTTFDHNKNNYIKLTECNKSIISDDTHSKYGIYNSTERYKISPQSPYAKIMRTNKQKYIGGPSGSTSVMYITLFQCYNYPFTYKNKIMLLGLLIADYVPLWHTIPEILMSAYPEFNDTNIKPYTLNENSVLYSIQLLKQFV